MKTCHARHGRIPTFILITLAAMGVALVSALVAGGVFWWMNTSMQKKTSSAPPVSTVPSIPEAPPTAPVASEPTSLVPTAPTTAMPESEKAPAVAPPPQETAMGTVQQAAHERFLLYRDQGQAAFKDKDYAAAILAFQNALKEEDDTNTFALLQEAIDKTTRPRIAVADFTTSGAIGLADAGKSVSELLLSRFEPTRFQLVERSHLADILNEQDLTISQLADNPTVLKNKKIKGVRYIVMGTVVKMGNLAVSARLVDAVTAEIVQTAQIEADDPVAMQNALAELAAMLQMTPAEKQAYLADRAQRAQEQAFAQAQASEEERQRQQDQLNEMLDHNRRWAAHEQQAFVVLTDVRGLISRGDFNGARRLARAALRDFADTSFAEDFVSLLDQAQREQGYENQARQQQVTIIVYRQQQEAIRRHQRFVDCRDRGIAAMNHRDWDSARHHFMLALREEDNRDVRATLNDLEARNHRPRLTILRIGCEGFEVGDPYRTYGNSVMGGFGTDRYDLVDRDQFLAVIRKEGLTVEAVMANPDILRQRRIQGFEFLVVVNVTKRTTYEVTSTMIDCSSGQIVQTSQLQADTVAELQQTFVESGRVLQMSGPEKAKYLEGRNGYAECMERARQAYGDGNWKMALEYYRRAYAIRRTDEAENGMTLCARKMTPRDSRPQPITLTVTAELDGRGYVGAQVTLNGRPSGRTPATMQLDRGQTYKVQVTAEATRDATYTSDGRTIVADKPGPQSFRANLRTVKPATGTPTAGPKPADVRPTRPTIPVATPPIAPPTTPPTVVPPKPVDPRVVKDLPATGPSVRPRETVPPKVTPTPTSRPGKVIASPEPDKPRVAPEPTVPTKRPTVVPNPTVTPASRPAAPAPRISVPATHPPVITPTTRPADPVRSPSTSRDMRTPVSAPAAAGVKEDVKPVLTPAKKFPAEAAARPTKPVKRTGTASQPADDVQP